MIHAFTYDDLRILLDVESGAVHLVDKLACDAALLMEEYGEEGAFSRLAETYPEEDAREVLSELSELAASGALFHEEQPTVRVNDNGELKAMCLNVAHDCNLRCRYCFAATGEYHLGRALMPFSVGRAALDFLVSRSGNRKNLEVDFFGGEPLMNWDVVKQIVAYGRSREAETGKHFRFTLTTNGVLLNDEVIDFCNREMHNVVLSLDGRKEVHDRLRRDYAGNGSYDTIVPNFRHFVEKRGDRGYYVRGTFTHNNVDFTEDLFHMADLGFTELSMEPVVCKPDEPYALTEEDLPRLYEQYEILAKDMLRRQQEGRPLTFYHYMINLAHGPCIYKRLSGCGSGTEYLAVTPWGELYPCHQFVGDEKYSMGNIWDGVTNTAMREEFKACNIYSRPQCADCWAKLYCSGGCAANAYHAQGEITGIYEYGCKLFRKRMECAIMMKAAEADLEQA